MKKITLNLTDELYQELIAGRGLKNDEKLHNNIIDMLWASIIFAKSKKTK